MIAEMTSQERMDLYNGGNGLQYPYSGKCTFVSAGSEYLSVPDNGNLSMGDKGIDFPISPRTDLGPLTQEQLGRLFEEFPPPVGWFLVADNGSMVSIAEAEADSPIVVTVVPK